MSNLLKTICTRHLCRTHARLFNNKVKLQRHYEQVLWMQSYHTSTVLLREDGTKKPKGFEKFFKDSDSQKKDKESSSSEEKSNQQEEPATKKTSEPNQRKYEYNWNIKIPPELDFFKDNPDSQWSVAVIVAVLCLGVAYYVNTLRAQKNKDDVERIRSEIFINQSSRIDSGR